MLNGKMIRIDNNKFEVTDGFSVTGLAEWIYQRIYCACPIDEMLEGYAEETGDTDPVTSFKVIIGEALEELGFYDYTGIKI